MIKQTPSAHSCSLRTRLMTTALLACLCSAASLSGAMAQTTDQTAGQTTGKSADQHKAIRVIEGVSMVPARADDARAPETGSASSSGQQAATTAGQSANGTIIPHAVDASVDDMQPYLQVRVVQNLQAQTAKGSTQALKAQRKLIINLNRHFLELPAKVWQNEQNARAAVIHLLSGGHPAVGHRLLSLDPPPAVDPALLKGALAYIEGRKNEAYRVFSTIDPLSLSPTLGGQIALVQAILALPDNLEDAQVAIDKARLLLPGSLVEEAALRRGVSVAAAENDTRLFQAYSLQYMRRFNNSIYNSDFRRRFAIAMRRFGESKEGSNFAELDTVISEFDMDARRSLYLLLSYSSLIAGNVPLAQQAAKAALPLTLDGSQDQSRSHLYLAGSMIDADSIKLSLQHLWKVQRSNLTSRDQILAEKISQVINNIRAWPETRDPALAFTIRPLTGDKGKPGWQLETLTEGRQAIRQTDLFLSSSKQSSLR
ncbi:chemotaxis protein [Cohaesibacter marisflavi]|uniref:chemotaxis protein n=1 Tax=Cohaesibacter marisflavi TaxID=655353 RepID=UPI0029C83848|nr:chemotaxis protein [Cohaesibacter marisflavi]